MGDNKNNPLTACGSSSFDNNSCNSTVTCCNEHNVYWSDKNSRGYIFNDKGTAFVCDYQ